MTEEAKKAHAEYMRAYRKEHRKQLNEYQRKWNSKNRDKIKAYHENYWEKKVTMGGDNAKINEDATGEPRSVSNKCNANTSKRAEDC